MKIEELYQNEKISARALTICKNNSIESLNELIEYFIKNKSFLRFRNCGKKSNNELIEICNSYKKEYSSQENPLNKITSELTNTQEETINNFINLNTNNLTQRSKNALMFYLDNNLHFINFVNKILLQKNNSLRKLNYVGTKSLLELETLFSKIENHFFEISNTSFDRLSSLNIDKDSFINLNKLSSLTKDQIEIINNFIFVNSNSLSNRSKNILLRYLDKNLKINNFATKILFTDSFNLSKLKNVGSKTIQELDIFISIVKDKFFEISKFPDIVLSALEKKGSNNFINLSNLSRVQREVINSFIHVNTNSLTVRSKNGILLHLNGNLKIKNFTEKILISDNFTVKEIKNVGAKCIPEIEVYISIIKDFFNEVSQSNDEKHLISLKNNFLIQRTFSISKIPSEILETESIFSLTNFLLNNNALFDKTQSIIVKKAFKIYQDQEELTLDDIANEVNLSRERVRQIRVICLDNLFNKLIFIKNFNDDLFQKYNIDIHSNQIEINPSVVDLINITNKTNLSREFITYILFAYLSDNFSLIGNTEDILIPKYINERNTRSTSNRYRWFNFYLIKKEIANEVDFDTLTADIENRIKDRIEESYSFNFKSYLSKFLTNNKIEILDLVFTIAEKIVNDEFELYLDLDENITFKRNTKKQVHEYALEALEELGNPSKINLILDKVLELNPNYVTDEASIRAAMARRNGFVPIGRKSVFGLKKWEKELDNFKGGTIKDVIIEFLRDKNEPTHISSVLEYLDKFRKNKDAKNVLTNLKLDPKKRFLIYNQGFIGLKINKSKYSNKYENLPIQLGKTIIGKYKKGHSINAIQTFLKKTYELNFDESILIINYLKYFNEN